MYINIHGGLSPAREAQLRRNKQPEGVMTPNFVGLSPMAW